MHKMIKSISTSVISSVIVSIIIIIQVQVNYQKVSANQEEKEPAFQPGASYLSHDGLTLIVTFDKPINLSLWIPQDLISPDLPTQAEQCSSSQVSSTSLTGRAQAAGQPVRPIQGIQLCARMLTKRTLKLLHSKYKLRNCLWATRVQFIVQLARQVAPGAQPIRLAFQRRALGAGSSSNNNGDIALELSRLPLESLGVSLSPRLALTGPNQVPPCGLFSLSAHLFAPYGSQSEEVISLSWRVERLGYVMPTTQLAAGGANSSEQALIEAHELRWRALERLVAATKSNNLLLDAQLLQQPILPQQPHTGQPPATNPVLSPQLYQFYVSATFAGPTLGQTSSINASHRVSQLDFSAPIGTVYGTHLLQLSEQVNPQQDLQLLAEVQVPECAANTKQVGLYWQVSDSRVRFDQTYAPFYLARAGSLPEQSRLEFRVNLFYGMRVKRFASSSATLSTGDSLLEAQISSGLLVLSSGSEIDDNQLELFATDPHGQSLELHRHAHLWSCFDGKTGQPCRIVSPSSLAGASGTSAAQLSGSASGALGTSNNSTRYELSTAHSARQLRLVPDAGGLLVDRERQREPSLRIPLSWIEPDAQLWFGLQRFEPRRQLPGERALNEYALFNLQSSVRGPSPQVALGPVLVGQTRQRATLRNPLTGALLLIEGVPAVIVGRLSPKAHLRSFAWRSIDYIQPLQWTARNSSNPSTGKTEILTELHLNQELQLAHGHYQFQLTACTPSGSIVEASLAIDVVPSVTQCKVVPTLSPLTGALVVSVDFCNIPLGLSPISYQLYLVDRVQDSTNPQDSNNNSNDSSDSLAAAAAEQSDYLDSSDEAQLESRAQPLTPVQLSPVFSLNTLGTTAFTSLVGSVSSIHSQDQRAQARFAARVCDKLQSCRMFYSKPIGLHLLTSSVSQASNRNSELVLPPPQQDLTSPQQVSDLAQWLQSSLDASWRANKAGNSIAAISLLNAAINLAQRRMSNIKTQDAVSQPHERLRNLQQVAVRELLQYATLSLNRQFHYLNSGQTNLVTNSLARVLSMPQSNLESKYKAIRLMGAISRKTIIEQQQQQQNLIAKISCLADFKTIQSAYESLLGTFSHYHLHEGSSEKWVASAGSMRSVALALTNSTPPPLSPEKSHATRKKREDAILAYLRSVRQAIRSLVAVAAIQLPLGDSQQFHYANPSNINAAELSSEATTTRTSSVHSVPAAQASGVNQQVAAPPSDIVTSLTHVTEITDESIDIELLEFGSVTLRFHPSFVAKLNDKIDSGQLNCQNGTRKVICSSIVLALTTYAGKAPFRSLDESLKVPLLEVNLLSPIDGSNLLDYQTDLAKSDTFKIDIKFTSTSKPDVSADSLPLQRPNDDQSNRLKCYQFNEEADEWSKSNVITESINNNRTPEEIGRDLIIRCTFNGPGVFAAFKGDPSSSLNSIKLSYVAIMIGVLGAILLLFLFTCLSSSSSSSSKSRKHDNHSENSNDDDDDGSTRARHPEQTYRNEFNYPI